MHYPSKQTIIIIVVCIVAIAGMAIYVEGRAPQNQETPADQPSIFARAQDEFASTTMSTSTDWKSAFLEMATSSNSFKTPAKVVTATSTEDLTATDKFGRGLFSQYVSLKQVGLNTNSDIVSSTISSLIAQSDVGMDKPRQYTSSDLKISNDTSVAALKAYGNTVGLLLKTQSPVTDDATLALAGIQGKDPSYVAELGDNIAKYKIILATLLNTPTPQSVSQYHLALINGASYMIFISSALAGAEKDPLSAISALKLYSTAFPLILQNLVNVRLALASAGISYNANEGGSFFNPKTQ
jgi:hypothetical protein